MLDIISNPIVISLTTFIITTLLGKYIFPFLPEAKVISEKMKPIIGGLAALFSKLLIFGFFMLFPILSTITFIKENGYIDELHHKFIIICCFYCVMLTLYLSFSIYITLRDRIEKLERKIEKSESKIIE